MISILIPFKGDGGRRSEIFSWVLRRYQNQFPEAEVCIGTDYQEPFSRSAARNNAFAKSHGDKLVICDADTVINRDQVLEACDIANSNERCFVLPYDVYYNLTDADTDQLLREDPGIELEEPKEWEFRLTDSVSGCLVMKREAWETVGGQCEAFQGWGFEDRALPVALATLWGPMRRLDGFVSHLWHPVSTAETWSQPFLQANIALYRKYLDARGKPEEMAKLR